MVHKLLGWLRRDVVLTVSLVLAAASCLAVPPSGAYWSYIDYDTLIILFCLMLIVEGLRRQNVFHAIAARVLSRVDTARGLAFTLIFLCFLSSMLITNDVALITFVPFGLMMMRMADMRERLTYTVTLMTVAANLGSMLTPIGNPQNLYLFSLSGLSLPGFLALTGPFAAGAAVLLALCVFFGYRQSALTIQVGKGDPLDRKSVGCYGALFLLCLLTVAGLIPHAALLVLVVLVLLWKDRTLFRQVDYSLILTFTFFFVFVGNMKQLEGLQVWISGALAGRERLLGVLVSQVISNVPAAMLLSGYSSDIPALIVGTNLGGLGTLIASMASLISYKQLANQYPHKKKKYLVVFTLVNVAFLLILYWL